MGTHNQMFSQYLQALDGNLTSPALDVVTAWIIYREACMMAAVELVVPMQGQTNPLTYLSVIECGKVATTIKKATYLVGGLCNLNVGRNISLANHEPVPLPLLACHIRHGDDGQWLWSSSGSGGWQVTLNRVHQVRG